jgi:hypothetical protein
MYLQGYGALFLMKVNFPLSAPPETQQQQEETEEKEDVDEVWQQTRQQIYEPQVESRRRTRSDQPEIIYDAEQIENLKTTLIESLKHAANIRALAPDESVIIRIAGSGQSVTVTSIAKEGEQSIISYESNGTQRTTVTSKDFPDFIKSLSTPSVLVIRAKKSDIDDFAKGELDLEDFREKVQVLSYPLLGGNAGGTPVSRTRSTGTTIVTR